MHICNSHMTFSIKHYLTVLILTSKHSHQTNKLTNCPDIKADSHMWERMRILLQSLPEVTTHLLLQKEPRPQQRSCGKSGVTARSRLLLMKLTATPPLESSVLDEFWKSFVASSDFSDTLKNYYDPIWGKNLKRKKMSQSCLFNFLKVLKSKVITTTSWNGSLTGSHMGKFWALWLVVKAFSASI